MLHNSRMIRVTRRRIHLTVGVVAAVMAVGVLSADAAVRDSMTIVQEWRPADPVPGGMAVPVYRSVFDPVIEDTVFSIEEVLPLPDGSVVVVQNRAKAYHPGDERYFPSFEDVVLLQPDGSTAILPDAPLLETSELSVGPDGTSTECCRPVNWWLGGRGASGGH